MNKANRAGLTADDMAAENRRRMAIDAMKEAGFASARWGVGKGAVTISVEDAERIASALGVQFVGNQ